jgi:membrane protease YdiL (CAAX protease family)
MAAAVPPWLDRDAARGAGVDGSDDGRAARVAARPWPLLGALVLLAAVNVLNNVADPSRYVLWACLAIAGLALLARADGLRRQDWGMGPVSRRAARAAAVLVAVTAAAMIVGTQLPGISSAYLDDRVAGMDVGELAFVALVRVPVGTALLEEVAFRGVLLAMLVRRFGTAWGVAGASAAFGAWHLVPALGIASANEALGSAFGVHTVVAAWVAMVAAGLAGVFLCLLRLRYDHLVAPLAVHMTANSLAYVLAWLMVRP